MYAGANVFLGPLLPEDSPLLFQWSNDVDLAHWNGPYRPVDWVSHSNWFANIGKEQTKAVLAIRRVADSRLVGYIQFANIHPVFRSAEIGIAIGAEIDRGHGYGQEALKLATRFAWNDLNLHRLALLIFGPNERAVKAYAKAGFRHEGLLRQAAFVDGRFVDITVMGLLRTD